MNDELQQLVQDYLAQQSQQPTLEPPGDPEVEEANTDADTPVDLDQLFRDHGFRVAGDDNGVLAAPKPEPQQEHPLEDITTTILGEQQVDLPSIQMPEPEQSAEVPSGQQQERPLEPGRFETFTEDVGYPDINTYHPDTGGHYPDIELPSVNEAKVPPEPPLDAPDRRQAPPTQIDEPDVTQTPEMPSASDIAAAVVPQLVSQLEPMLTSMQQQQPDISDQLDQLGNRHE